MGSLKEKIDADIKAALLGGDRLRVDVLRNLKSAILYAEVAGNAREKGLDDVAVLAVISRESRKRNESIELYRQGGAEDRARQEEAEKAIIDSYLPQALSEDEVKALIDKVVKDVGSVTPQNMGQIIGRVKLDAGPSADGAVIARLVKELLN